VEKIWDLGNLLPKLYLNPTIKSQDQTSRRKRPDGRTRRGHAPKRVASRHTQAAETRPKPRFRGISIISWYGISWRTSNWTLLPSAPINTPCSATEKGVQRQSQRAKSRVLGFLLLSSLGFLFFFNFYVSEGEGYVERDTDVCFSSLPLYQVIKVTFIFYYCFTFLFVFFSFSTLFVLIFDKHASDSRTTSITSLGGANDTSW